MKQRYMKLLEDAQSTRVTAEHSQTPETMAVAK